MSQTPVLPEESTTETVKKPVRRGRKPKAEAAPEALHEAPAVQDVLPEAEPAAQAEAASAVKKTVRRGRKPKAEAAAAENPVSESAPGVAVETAEAPKPRRGRPRKVKADVQDVPAESGPVEVPAPETSVAAPVEGPAEAAPAKPRRGRKPKAEAAPAEVQPENLQQISQPEEAVGTPSAEEAVKAARKTVKRNRKLNGAQSETDAEAASAPVDQPEADAVADKNAPRERADRRNPRSRKGRNPRIEAEPLGSPDYDSALDDDDQIVHLGSAVVLDDMLPPSGLREDDGRDEEEAERPNRRNRNDRRNWKNRQQESVQKAAPGNQAPEKSQLPDDDIGNRVEAPAKQSSDAQPEWFDDGIVTNILPYANEYGGDVRSHRRINTRKGRRYRDAQPLFNGSPYLPAPYQQEFYGQLQPPLTDTPFGNRKDRRGKKGRRNQQAVPVLPAEFDFNAAMLNDSVLGAAFGRQEEEDFIEDDGPQPVILDQPVAQPFSSGDLAEEDLEALDAAVNGNRIAAPARPQQKENRKDRKGRKNKDEKAPREENTARDDKAAVEETKAEASPEQAKAVRALYISSVPDEQVEVVITEDGLVTEYFVDMAHQVKIRGNIYKGVINNIDTNLQAAFVNFGNGKNGFLQIDEVHPEYYLVHHDSSRGPKYPPIQKVMKVGQEVLVQVVKEPAGTKGAFLTTWISIAGRFLVLTPGQEQIGVSRKVEDPEERARLKELLNDIQPGENMGVIIRTASEGVNKVSIQQDLQQLQRMWKDIQKKAQQEKSPSLIYQEADLATRSVRDYLSEDIEDIWTDDEETKKRLEGVIDVIFPDRKNFHIKLHKDHRQTMWERFGLLKQLDSVTSREVILPSGGRLVFDQTEALMAIDINSGKTQGKTNFEAMVFRTNMEAAEAIARHLRLRDIGGQVVIDFIEMRDKNHCREVERTIRNAMRKDRARHDVGHMSSFGLLELVRQRTGTSAISITTEPCPHCHGTGVRRNLEWQALQAMRDLRSKLCKSLDSGKTRKADPKNEKAEMATFVYESTAELALYILNRKRDRIAALEEKFGVHIEIRLK